MTQGDDAFRQSGGVGGGSPLRRTLTTTIVESMRTVLFALFMGLLISVSGCSAGTDFKRPDSATVRLGKTTEGEIRERFGQPRGEGSVLRNDARVKTLSYAYAEAAPYVEKVSVRGVVFSFHEGVLVGYDYTSSFSSDKTDFDDSSVGRIKSGETSADQVIDKLGKPTGEFIYPLVKAKDGKAYVYSYSRTDKGPEAYPLASCHRTR